MDVHESLIQFTELLREQANKTAALSSAGNDDRRILKEDAELLTNSVESLVKIIETHDALVLWAANVFRDARPEHKAKLSGLGPHVLNGLVDLSSALMMAFHIGGRVLESPIFKKLEKETRAARARKNRELKSRQCDRDISSLIEPILIKQPTWTAGRITAAIAESFNKDRESPLKDNAIEKRVRKLVRMRRTEKSSA